MSSQEQIQVAEQQAPESTESPDLLVAGEETSIDPQSNPKRMRKTLENKENVAPEAEEEEEEALEEGEVVKEQEAQEEGEVTVSAKVEEEPKVEEGEVVAAKEQEEVSNESKLEMIKEIVVDEKTMAAQPDA